MEIEFPIEFIVQGRAVSLQAKRAATRDEWKERVKAASAAVIPQPHFASTDRIALTIYNLPAEPMQGDVDNIVKLILDALCRHIYIDDPQVERVVVQKFEPGNIFEFASPSETLAQALVATKPVVYIRISNDPFEELG
jgi:hypothetical protein